MQVIAQILIQFMRGHDGLWGIQFFLLEIYQIISQLCQVFRTLHSQLDVLLPVFTQTFLFHDFTQRSLDHGQRSAYVVRGMREEIDFFFRSFPFTFDELIAQESVCRSDNQQGIYQEGPESEPERTFYQDLYFPFFQYLLVVEQNGAYLQRIVSRRQVGIPYGSVAGRRSPLVIEPFQFPAVQNARRIVEIDGRHIHGERVLVVFQLDETGFVQNFCQRRILFHRVHRMIHDVQVREYHVAGKA